MTKMYTIALLRKFGGIISLLVLVLFSVTSCSSWKLDRHIVALKSLNSQIDGNDWEVLQRYTFDGDTKFTLTKRLADTTHLFSFFHTRVKGEHKYSLVYEYIKSWSDKGFYYQIALLNSDTLYFYKTETHPDFITPSEEAGKIFISGKYYFKYLHRSLSLPQRAFFEAHRDSLIRIKGNDLEPLPEYNKIN